MKQPTRRDIFKGGLAASIAGAGATLRGATSAQAATAPAGWQPPQKQSGNRLNLVVLVSDTFRADNLEVYGSQWVDTPALNRFAQESVVFEQFYPEGMPTVPIRRQLYTGRRIFPTHTYFQQSTNQSWGWHPLFIEDVTLAETLRAADYRTALIADVYHIMKPGMNFQRGFDDFEWIRGQEIDFWAQAPRVQPSFRDIYPEEYFHAVDEATPNGRGGAALRKFVNQYLANRKRWRRSGESIAELTAKSSIRWLKENHDQGPFYLHVEVFDPHEPWDPPTHFLDKYLKEPTTHSWLEPPYAHVKVPEEGVRRFRANYAGEASAVDYWYGQVIETMRSLGLYDNTVIVFLSDHGAMLNEQGQWCKGPEKIRKQVSHVPLLLHVPGAPYNGRRVSGFAQTPDVFPTVLGRLGLKAGPRVTGHDLWPYVTGEKTNPREYIVSAFGGVASVRTPEWNYSAIWNRDHFQGDYKPQLYDLKKDPDELTTVADQHPEVLTHLQSKMDEYLASGKDLTNGTFAWELSKA
ncbi:MAG TPA: sulfatase [Acidobacteriaceae bacterium]|nr:sulfatase [Acidobacteriaceae bacterium]